MRDKSFPKRRKNQKERGILLPSGCKDLIDVLRLPAPKTADPVDTFIRTVLLRGEGDTTAELVICRAMVHDGDCSVMQRVSGFVQHLFDIPSEFRSRIVAELLRLAGLTGSQYPIEGIVCLQLKRRQLKWKIQLESQDAECVLTPFSER